MKYQFNEQELLSLFYDKENDMRPDMAAPYLKNGYVCATEAHILIRIKAETLNGKYNEIEGLNIDFPADNCNFIIGLQDIRTAIASIPQVEEKEKVGKNIECEECNGEGEVRCVHQDPARPCIFRVDDNIEIIIMPCLADDNYHIEGRDAE